MPKDNLSMNPAMAQRKAEKQKQLKKNKAEAQARRNEKLGRRNPDRIQRQINDIKAIEESGQKLRPRDQQLLEALQRDLRAVQKAREALGDQAPKFDAGRGGGSFRGRGRGDSGRGGGGVLGKRRRDEHGQFFNDDGDSSSTDEEVRRIPMPRDTPPPIPKEYQRRQGRVHDNGSGGGGAQGPHALPSKPATAEPPKTVYEAKPEIRNLRQEATKMFIPAAVRAKQDSIRGQGKLLEPEEMDRLEQAGYQAGPADQPAAAAAAAAGAGAGDQGEGKDKDKDEDEGEVLRRLQEEERRFNQELKSVQIEEVEDEDA